MHWSNALPPSTSGLVQGRGVHLQRADSDLALAVLQKMEDASVVVLPIHDSFMVAEQHKDLLWSAMHDAFREQFGFDPVIDAKPQRSGLA